MIGDREHGDGYEREPKVDLGPLDAMVRLEPPDDLPIPAWIERYGAVVVIRHTHADGPGVAREIYCSSDGTAVQRYARAVAELVDRGYQVIRW